MQNFDYDAFVADLKSKNAIPLVVIYGTKTDSGTDLNWLSTNAFDNADGTLKKDTVGVVGAVARQMESED